MDFNLLLQDLRNASSYKGQAVYVREVSARSATYQSTARPLSPQIQAVLRKRGIDRLYSHQAEALDAVQRGENVLVSTGTSSGKSLCYVLPILDDLLEQSQASSLLLFPTKALCQDQFQGMNRALQASKLDHVMAGVYDGDTPGHTRRKLRDNASLLFSNPDMLHAGLMPHHARWGSFLKRLRFVVLDEIHVYNGMFGSNAANLLRRFHRLCRHYGSCPQWIGCSATIGNPQTLAERLTGLTFTLVNQDGSPRGRRTFVFWNPPRIRGGDWRSRRSANVEAQELMAMLIERDVPTITFSKAKMTAEMIHRYVCETLQRTAPHKVKKMSPYRGGYLPQERRDIEKKLFQGKLLGISTTRALELGIDVGGLDASVLVGYPGTLASFYQQSGRAGRQNRDSLVVLVGLDTAVNQYIMSTPEYIFGRPVEQSVIDPDNPFVLTGHLRCAAHELPLPDQEVGSFGPYASMVLNVLQDNKKVRKIEKVWYYAASELPQHEVPLRDYAEANVVIEDCETGAVLGEVDEFDAEPILHPEAIYMHKGDTYRVLDLNLDRHIAKVKREEVDYYTQPRGGTDVHHIDYRLREKPFGTGMAYWGEVTAYFNTYAYEKIHFYSLDALSIHGLDLPTMSLETMAFWIVSPEDLLDQIRTENLDVHAGCRGIGYALRMLMPLFVTCDTLDFSHSVGSVNSPWQAIFLYERYPHGLGFTEEAYERLHEIVPATLDHIRSCDCEDGCPCCVGKPLRQYTTWNVERGEASIPSKKAATRILEGLLGGGSSLDCPDHEAFSDEEAGVVVRLERSLRRRLERLREPKVFHPIEPNIETQYPEPESEEALDEADVARRSSRRRDFQKDLHKRIAEEIRDDGLDPLSKKKGPPKGTWRPGGRRKPTDFQGKPEKSREEVPDSTPPKDKKMIQLGDSLASRARRRRKKK